MESGVQVMTESAVETGQSEPPPIGDTRDLLPDSALENVNKSHVGVPEESPTTYFNQHHCSNILKVLKQQQNTAELCDAVFIVNNQQIPVHSCVIAANSPYLKDLFDMNTNTNRIPGQPLPIALPTTSLEVAENLIGYMYSGDISITTRYVDELLQLTDKLMMDDVRQCCELHMIKSVDVANWSTFLVIAKSYGFRDLSVEVVNFLGQNLMIVKDTKSFPCLDRNDVLEIMNASNPCEGSDLELGKLEFLLNWVSFDLPNNVDKLKLLLQSIKPDLLNSQGISKIFEDLMKRELYEHELIKNLKDEVRNIEEARDKEARELAEEMARKEAEKKKMAEAEEVAKREELEREKAKNEVIKPEEAKQEETRKFEAVKNTEVLENVTQSDDSETVRIIGTVTATGSQRDGGETSPTTVEETAETNKSVQEMEVHNHDVRDDGSDTEVEEDPEKEPEAKTSPVKKSEKDQKPSVAGKDAGQYLADGTLIIQPESVFHGRGKRKSYKPKKIHSGTGRPRGRPRKNFQPPSPRSSVVENTEEKNTEEKEVVPPPRRRGRPPLYRSSVARRVCI